MDEGSKDREVKNIISDLFPVKKKSVVGAFESLSPDEEKRIFSETNPHVSASFEELLEPHGKKNAKQMLFGALVCHRALREEAKSRDGLLPTFTERFAKEYDTEQDERVERELEEQTSRLPYQVGLQISRKNIAMFRNLEPEFSKIVEEKLGTESGWIPEQDFTYLGIIDEYFVFRKGCSDPKNFQK